MHIVPVIMHQLLNCWMHAIVLGMLVLDEQRLLNSSPEYMSQFERLIKRDRNHPSVFIWSIGNEEGWIQTQSTGKRIAQTLLAKQKELDPTRTSVPMLQMLLMYSMVSMK